MTTRRTILTGLAVATVPLPAIAAPEEPEERVQRLTAELAAAMAEIHGGTLRTRIDHYHGVVVVAKCRA